MTEIQIRRWDSLLRRVADLKGQGSKVGDALTELFPTLDVENVPGELLALGGIRICMGGGGTAASVGNAGTGQLFNPLGTGVICTITSVYVSSDATATMRWGLGQVALGASLQTQLFRDLRFPPPALPVCQVRVRTAVAQANATNQVRVLQAEPLTLQDPNGVAVLLPGHGFEIGTNVNNNEFNFGFNWRERPVEPSELRL